jgi:hypothetical protein
VTTTTRTPSRRVAVDHENAVAVDLESASTTRPR